MLEHRDARPRYRQQELEAIANNVEKFPVDPHLPKTEDLRRRIYLVLNSPAYKNDNRPELFRAVRETLARREAPTAPRPEAKVLPMRPKVKKRDEEMVEAMRLKHLIEAEEAQQIHPEDAYENSASPDALPS